MVVGGSSGKAAGGKGASVEQKVGERLPSDAVSTTDSYFKTSFANLYFFYTTKNL